jgi:hypothetical protein
MVLDTPVIEEAGPWRAACCMAHLPTFPAGAVWSIIAFARWVSQEHHVTSDCHAGTQTPPSRTRLMRISSGGS